MSRLIFPSVLLWPLQIARGLKSPAECQSPGLEQPEGEMLTLGGCPGNGLRAGAQALGSTGRLLLAPSPSAPVPWHRALSDPTSSSNVGSGQMNVPFQLDHSRSLGTAQSQDATLRERVRFACRSLGVGAAEAGVSRTEWGVYTPRRALMWSSVGSEHHEPLWVAGFPFNPFGASLFAAAKWRPRDIWVWPLGTTPCPALEQCQGPPGTLVLVRGSGGCLGTGGTGWHPPQTPGQLRTETEGTGQGRPEGSRRARARGLVSGTAQVTVCISRGSGIPTASRAHGHKKHK